MQQKDLQLNTNFNSQTIMKRNLIALAALILGLVSCQNDFNDVTNNARGEVDFQLAINAPEITRAGDEVGNEKAGMNSAYVWCYRLFAGCCEE